MLPSENVSLPTDAPRFEELVPAAPLLKTESTPYGAAFSALRRLPVVSFSLISVHTLDLDAEARAIELTTWQRELRARSLPFVRFTTTPVSGEAPVVALLALDVQHRRDFALLHTRWVRGLPAGGPAGLWLCETGKAPLWLRQPALHARNRRPAPEALAPQPTPEAAFLAMLDRFAPGKAWHIGGYANALERAAAAYLGELNLHLHP